MKFKYTGEQDTLVPQLLFYPHSITKDIVGFGSGFLLTDQEFKKLKSLLMQDLRFKRIKVANDSVNAGLYNFYISDNSGIVAYYSSDKEILRDFFVDVSNQLTDTIKKNSIKNEFYNILQKF